VPFHPRSPSRSIGGRGNPYARSTAVGLFRKDRWVYIGKGDIRQRLLGHLAGDILRVLHNRPTHWVAVETADCDAAEEELIIACDPICKPAVVMDFGGRAPRVERTDGRRGAGRPPGSPS
jgi:hypothetical protein